MDFPVVQILLAGGALTSSIFLMALCLAVLLLVESFNSPDIIISLFISPFGSMVSASCILFMGLLFGAYKFKIATLPFLRHLAQLLIGGF